MKTKELPHFMPEGYDVSGDPYFKNRARESRQRHEAQMTAWKEELDKMGEPGEKSPSWYARHKMLVKAVVFCISFSATWLVLSF